MLLIFWAPKPNNKENPEPELTDKSKGQKPGRPYSTLTLMTWNIGFGGGEKGVPTKIYTADEIQKNLSLIEQTIKRYDPDILLLQEVDRPSKRSDMIDEYNELMDRLGFDYGCFVTTWHCNYVPFPKTFNMEDQLGLIYSGQAILSKIPILDCKGIRLPQPEEPAWVKTNFPWIKRHIPFAYKWLTILYNKFYIHRTIQVATIDLGMGNHLPIFNCHLEAFGQKNREEQSNYLYNELAKITGPMIVGGDFNTLPFDATKKRGFVDEDIDFTTDRTMNSITQVRGLNDTLSGSGYDEASTFTFPSYEPTRRLDYLMERGFMLESDSATVIRDAKGSDHLPIVVNLVQI